jgi:predicted oxidoreductase
MESISLGVSPLRVSQLAYGCWRVAGTWDPAEVTPESRAAGRAAIRTAFDAGYTLFDTADIYCRGESEKILGETLREVPGMRDKVVIATKCGIRFPGTPGPDSPQRYDFSGEHIVSSAEGSLKRLGVEVIDLLMLHRPDFLADPLEIAEAFSKLKGQGKVRFFGISNFRPTLVTALQVICPMPLIAHQVEISLLKTDAFTDGTLDQCLIERITPMAWSPLAGGVLGHGAKKLLPSQEGYRAEGVASLLQEIGQAHGASSTAIALAWLMKHPSRIMPIVGSVRSDRIRDAAQASKIKLSRDEWYKLLLAARGEPLP